MDLRLKGKVVLVTGGAKGIGAAVARACALEAALPVIVSRDSETVQKLQSELRNAGTTCELIHADLSTPSAYAKVIQEAVKAFGRIDALVNSVEGNSEVGRESGNPADFVASLDRGLTHYYNITHFALPHLKPTKGVIINIASETDTAESACMTGGLRALTREWAAELLPYGIRVNAILCSEATSPEEITATTVFLISPESGHTTGQHLMFAQAFASPEPEQFTTEGRSYFK
jgi:L-fucose dehydrogenase